MMYKVGYNVHCSLSLKRPVAMVVRYDSRLEWCAKVRMLCWGGAAVAVGEAGEVRGS